MPRLNVHVYPAPCRDEPRLLKMRRTLVDAGVFSQIVIMGVSDRGVSEMVSLGKSRRVQELPCRVSRISLRRGRVILERLEWSGRVLWALRNEEVDCINCNTVGVLPVCVAIKALKGSKLVYDVHELETEQSQNVGLRRFLVKAIERLLIRHVDTVIVSSESIARWYEEEYGFAHIPALPNFRYRPANRPTQTRVLRDELGIAGDRVMFLFQGNLIEGRGIANMLEVFAGRPDRDLVFMGRGPLTGVVQAHARRYKHIHYRAPVSPDVLARYTASADVGMSVLENTCLSNYSILPNKLFEYVQSGVPVIVSDFPEQAGFVDNYACGWKVSPTAPALGALIDRLTPEAIEHKRRRAMRAATSFGWEDLQPRLLSAYSKLFDQELGLIRGFAVPPEALEAVVEV